jgi:endoplasmic reticulum resident protein 44
MHPPGEPIVVFRADKARSNEQDETFTGNLNVYDELNTWVNEKCVPLVREITFENAEELTEDGIPFLILFHKPEDNESVKKFNDVVRNELMSERSKFHVCRNTSAVGTTTLYLFWPAQWTDFHLFLLRACFSDDKF